MLAEAYGQNFRNYRKENSQTYGDFTTLNSWCSSKKIASDYAKLHQLLLIEEFKRYIIPDVKSFLDECKIKNLEEPARLEDDYALTHKVSFVPKSNFKKPFSSQTSS